MKQTHSFMQSFDQLPETLPIFPLNNAVVMPGTHLPLNIFEPRYLNMIQDAMKTHRLIGMIQPRDESLKPELFTVGCAARITRYEETSDGLIEISLTGVCRFEIKKELISTRGYRLIIPKWNKFALDYEDSIISPEVHGAFIISLRMYFNTSKFELDWNVMKKLGTDHLFNSLYCFIDLSSEDKQILLEIDTLDQRIRALTAILESKVSKNQILH